MRALCAQQNSQRPTQNHVFAPVRRILTINLINNIRVQDAEIEDDDDYYDEDDIHFDEEDEVKNKKKYYDIMILRLS